MRFLFISALLLTVFPLFAKQNLPGIGPDEGFVVVSIFAPIPPKWAEIDSDGFFTGSIKISDFPSAEYFEVHKLKAGEYYWNKLSESGGGTRYFDLKNDGDEYQIVVEPGKIVYAGSLVFNKYRNGRATIYMANRPAYVVTQLNEKYNIDFKKIPLISNGKITDKFIEKYFSSEEGE